MNVTPQLCRYATFVVFILTAAPVGSEAGQFVCWPIALGDTAAGLALRLTGSAASRDAHWFQIRNPASGSFVPKSRYERLSAGWQACVLRDMLSSAAAVDASDDIPRRYNVRFASLVGFAVSLMLFSASITGTYVLTRRIPPDMQRAGEQFVAAFARPLIDPSSGVAPITARFRFVPQSEQLEIFIAPHVARRYPNLSDHRKNVEYDINRVAPLLRPNFIVGDRLRAHGKWIVVPVLRTDFRQAGVK